MTQRSQPNLLQALPRWLFLEPLIQVVKGTPEKTTVKNVRPKKWLHCNKNSISLEPKLGMITITNTVYRQEHSGI